MADEYEKRMAELQEQYEDEDGDVWTPAQIRAAGEAMAKDKAGEGSFGGVAEEEDPNADVDALVAQATSTPSPKRELNPLNFGDFFKSNIFGGVGAGYVTGKRPMTAYDYASDVLIGYGGGDIGKRNADLRKGAAESRLTNLKAEEAGQNIKAKRSQMTKDEAQTRKLGLESEKLVGDEIQRMMTDLDSDLWPGELKSLAKEHGLNLRPGIVSMVERMTQMLSEAGVRHPAEVLQSPETYDPRLVNRVRHTMRLLTKTIEENEAATAETETKKQALGMKDAENQRAQEKADRERNQEGGYEAAIYQLEDEINQDPENRELRQRNNAKIAALQTGGTAAQQVLESMSGIQSAAGGRNARWQGLVTRATEELGEGASPGEIQARAQELENEDKARASVNVADAKALAEKERLVAEGLGQLDQMRTEMAGAGMGESGFLGGALSMGKAAAGKFVDIPSVRTVDAVNSNLTNIARSLGGQKGVLSDIDVAIMTKGLGFRPGAGDTIEGWERRVQVFEGIAKAGLEELRASVKERREPRKIVLSAKERAEFGGTGGGMEREGAAGGDKQAEAAAIRAEADPAKKQRMAQEFMKKYGGR